MSNLENLKKKAKKIVSDVSNSPDGRLQLRYKFYQKYGNPFIKGNDGLGNSEIAFMEWEKRRGVLNALDMKDHGSKWWRTVNSHFLYVSELAGMIHEAKIVYSESSQPIKFWLDYINKPNEVTWYKAHNSSIIDGYKVADALAYDEDIYEQYFMNIVLYRVLYAQSMVEGVNFGLLGKLFANPRGKAVGLITGFEDFYPEHYPLSPEGIKAVLHKSHSLIGFAEDFMDKILILPQLSKLYKEAASWNASPILMSYIKDNKPCYPISKPTLQHTHFNTKLNIKNLDS